MFPALPGTEWRCVKDGQNCENIITFLADGTFKVNKGRNRQGNWKLDADETILEVNYFSGNTNKFRYLAKQKTAEEVDKDQIPRTTMWIRGMQFSKCNTVTKI